MEVTLETHAAHIDSIMDSWMSEIIDSIMYLWIFEISSQNTVETLQIITW